MKNIRTGEETEMKRMEKSKYGVELIIGFACIVGAVVFMMSCLAFAVVRRLDPDGLVYQHQFATLITQSGCAFIVTVFASFVISRVHDKRDR